MDGWKMTFLLGNLIFRCELLVSGRVVSGRVISSFWWFPFVQLPDPIVEMGRSRWRLGSTNWRRTGEDSQNNQNGYTPFIGFLRIPREDWGTLGKIRGITTPPKQNPIIRSVGVHNGRWIVFCTSSYGESAAFTIHELITYQLLNDLRSVKCVVY